MVVSDSGLTEFDTRLDTIPRFSINATKPRFLYAYDLADGRVGKYLQNKRVIYMAHEFGVDGVRVAANGYIIGATGTA